MAEYRLDYVKVSGARGIWEYEQEFSSDKEAVLSFDPKSTLPYAKSRLPGVRKLVVVKITEQDIHVET